MSLKKDIALIMMGIGGTLMYQQVMNGNAKKMMKDMKKFSKKTIDDLEDMM